MKKKIYVVKIILAIVFIAIITNQVLWIYNMYESYERKLHIDIDGSFKNAIYQEVTKRGESGGGFSAFSLNTDNEDNSRYIEKTIQGIDTTFTVSVDRHDPNANLKIAQTVLKDIAPLDIEALNKFFIQEMKDKDFPVQEAYIEYYDLTKNILEKSSGDKQLFTSYISSDMIVIDILESIGVKAYVKNPALVILRAMIAQLISSITLIILAIVGLFYLIRTIFRQWKEEKMRQDSVNAMTHEFRRPISTAVNLVSLIPHYIETNDLPCASKYAMNTMDALNKLTAYTTRIQQISNNEKSTISIERSSIEILPFMESLIKKYQKQEGEQSADRHCCTAVVNLDINPECTVINADRIHFANVIDNLIENAIKYSKEKPVIDISVDLQDKFLRISVKDNGIGISASDIKHVFEKFYRVDRSLTNNKAGFGLGLTYVKSIIEEHGGHIEAKSNGKGLGSEFVLYVPQ